MEFDDDWEEYNPESGLSLHHHMIAGSFAGLSEHVVMFPVDTVKTHIQAQPNQKPLPIMEQLRSLMQTQGVMRPWRGVHTMLLGCVPAHAAYFSVYEAIKASSLQPSGEHSTMGVALAGAVGVSIHDAIMTPFDCIKQRLQLGYYQGVWDCARTVIRTEGAMALYRAYPTTLLMNMPFHGILVTFNETFKGIIGPQTSYIGQLSSFLCSGFAAGGIAAFLTTPLDVVKTRLQTQSLSTSSPLCCASSVASPPSASPKPSARALSHLASALSLAQRRAVSVSSAPPVSYKGLGDALVGIVRTEGWRGLMRGAAPRAVVAAPSAAISWTAYEVGKKMFIELK